MKAIFQAYERNAALILASEKWADGYSKSPETHAKLIKASARLQRKILVFFKDEAARMNEFIDWHAYEYAMYEVKASRVDAYDINVIVSEVAIAASDNEFIKVVFDEIASSTTIGAQAGEAIYKMPLGISKNDSAMQKLIWNQVARLVGKRQDKDGNLVDARKGFTISDKTRDDIRSSIKNSLNLNEDVQAAAKRLGDTIKNASRAETIANTETVNAYNLGLTHFGQESGAVGKEWTDNGALDVCKQYADLKAVPFEYEYDPDTKLTEPAAHPNCRCYIRLIYQNELDDNPDLFG